MFAAADPVQPIALGLGLEWSDDAQGLGGTGYAALRNQLERRSATVVPRTATGGEVLAKVLAPKWLCFNGYKIETDTSFGLENHFCWLVWPSFEKLRKNEGL